MSFGSGFLQGMQVGQNFAHKKVLMRQRQEDRDREQYGRDLTALMNDWKHTIGDRSEEEFSNSDDFVMLAKRHANSKVFSKAMQQGGKNGNTVKLRDILKDQAGKNILIVDTYDKEGRLISKGRPVTNNRESLETNPNDVVSRFGNQDLFHALKGALQASDSYVDMVGQADRADALIDSTLPEEPGLADKNAPPVNPYDPGPVEEGLQASGAVTSAVAPSDDVQSTPLEEDKELTPEEQAALATSELTDAKQAHDKKLQIAVQKLGAERRAMSMQQRSKADAEIATMYEQSEKLSEEIEALSPSFSAEDVGRAVRNVPGIIADRVKRDIDSVVEHPTVKAGTDAIVGFVKGLTGDGEEEAPPAPDGTSKSEDIETGAEKQGTSYVQGNKTLADYIAGNADLKPQTKAQKNKIASVSQDIVATVNANQPLTRKQLMAWRKANRAQIIYGDKTAAQGAKDYYALLERHKAKTGNYSMTYDKERGIAMVLNEDTGTISRSQQGAPDSNGSDEDERKRADANYKKMVQVADIEFGKRDDEGRTKAEFVRLMDKSNNTMQIIAQQDGYHAMMADAFANRQAAVADASSWRKWASESDAKRLYSSLSPFLAAEVMKVDSSDAETMGALTNKLTLANGKEMSEADWVDVTSIADVLVRSGLSGKELEDNVTRLYADFKAGK